MQHNRPKLPLIRINYSDLLEDEPLGGKAGRSKLGLDKKSLVINKRKIAPDHQRKGSVKKVFQSKDVFVRPKPAPLKTETNIRKKLFGGSSIMNDGNFNERIMCPPKITVELNNTQPLKDITDAEKQLYHNPHCLTTFNKEPTVRTPSILKKTPVFSKMFPSNNDDLIKSNISANEHEFLKIERALDNNNKANISSVLKNYVIEEEEHLKNMKDRLKSLQCVVVELENQIAQYEQRQKDNKAQILEHLQITKESSSTNSNWHVTVLNGEAPERLSASKESKKKNVAFNLENLSKDNEATNFDGLQDNGLVRAVCLYNSMRTQYRSILSTPKLERAALQTPISSKRGEADIARRVQKQCLLLLDSPNQDI